MGAAVIGDNPSIFLCDLCVLCGLNVFSDKRLAIRLNEQTTLVKSLVMWLKYGFVVIGSRQPGGMPDRLSDGITGCIKMFEFTTRLEVFSRLKSRDAG